MFKTLRILSASCVVFFNPTLTFSAEGMTTLFSNTHMSAHSIDLAGVHMIFCDTAPDRHALRDALNELNELAHTRDSYLECADAILNNTTKDAEGNRPSREKILQRFYEFTGASQTIEISPERLDQMSGRERSLFIHAHETLAKKALTAARNDCSSHLRRNKDFMILINEAQRSQDPYDFDVLFALALFDMKVANSLFVSDSEFRFHADTNNVFSEKSYSSMFVEIMQRAAPHSSAIRFINCFSFRACQDESLKDSFIDWGFSIYYQSASIPTILKQIEPNFEKIAAVLKKPETSQLSTTMKQLMRQDYEMYVETKAIFERTNQMFLKLLKGNNGKQLCMDTINHFNETKEDVSRFLKVFEPARHMVDALGIAFGTLNASVLHILQSDEWQSEQKRLFLHKMEKDLLKKQAEEAQVQRVREKRAEQQAYFETQRRTWAEEARLRVQEKQATSMDALRESSQKLEESFAETAPKKAKVKTRKPAASSAATDSATADIHDGGTHDATDTKLDLNAKAPTGEAALNPVIDLDPLRAHVQDVIATMDTLDFNDVLSLLSDEFQAISTRSNHSWQIRFTSPLNNQKGMFFADNPHGAQLEKGIAVGWRKNMHDAFVRTGMIAR